MDNLMVSQKCDNFNGDDDNGSVIYYGTTPFSFGRIIKDRIEYSLSLRTIGDGMKW
jgi:hypothetical protein